MIVAVLPRAVDAAVVRTAGVVVVNVAPVLPAGTVTVEGTVAEPGSLLVSVTVVSLRPMMSTVTVPVLEFPPTTVAGLTASAVTCGTRKTVIAAVAGVP